MVVPCRRYRRSSHYDARQAANLSFWLNGETVIANADGTALFDGGRVLAVADLHLEKGRALATTAPMPGYDTDATLNALMTAITRDQPEMILFLVTVFTVPIWLKPLPMPIVSRSMPVVADVRLSGLSAITIRHCRHSFPAGRRRNGAARH